MLEGKLLQMNLGMFPEMQPNGRVVYVNYEQRKVGQLLQNIQDDQICRLVCISWKRIDKVIFMIEKLMILLEWKCWNVMNIGVKNVDGIIINGIKQIHVTLNCITLSHM